MHPKAQPTGMSYEGYIEAPQDFGNAPYSRR